MSRKLRSTVNQRLKIDLLELALLVNRDDAMKHDRALLVKDLQTSGNNLPDDENSEIASLSKFIVDISAVFRNIENFSDRNISRLKKKGGQKNPESTYFLIRKLLVFL